MQNSNTQLSLISFNTLGVPVISTNLSERYVALADTINNTDANVLAFQEVHTYVHLHILKKLLHKEFPYLCYKKFIYGPQGGLVVFSKFPLELESFNRFSKRGTFKNSTFYGKFIMNGILICRFKDLPLAIINTYLTTNPNKTWDSEGIFKTIQESQITDINTALENIKDKGLMAIIAGDFNFLKTSAQYERFVKTNKAKDIFENFSLPTYLKGRKSLKFLWRVKFIDKFFVFNAKESGRVDYIFVVDQSNKVAIKETKHLFDEKITLFNGKESYLSDHIGLYAKLDIKN